MKLFLSGATIFAATAWASVLTTRPPTRAPKDYMGTLTADARAVLKADLDAWKQQFGAEALQDGLLPKLSNILSTEDVENEQLQRLLDTQAAVEIAKAANPKAEFSWKNKFALMTQEEFAKYVSISFEQDAHRLRGAGETQDDAPAAVESSTSSVDWTTSSNCVSPVRNQGQCGSCWAFSTIGAVESAHCIKTGTLYDLSEQQVVSCSKNGGSQGCRGGWPWYAIDWMVNGVCLEQDWPYTSDSTGQTGQCNNSCTKQQLAIGKNVYISGDSALSSALLNQPVAVTVTAGNDVWRNYVSGIVTSCPNARSDHAVLAVGVTDTEYKIKNSWGSTWGSDGYIYLQRYGSRQGTCNVVGAATYPRI